MTKYGRLLIWLTIILVFLKTINILNISCFFVLLPVLLPPILVFLFIFFSLILGLYFTIKYK